MVLGSDLLDVEQVRVEGAAVLDDEQVRQVAAISTGEPLARVDLDAAIDRVGELPAVASVEVTRDWPGAIDIVVEERQAVAVLSDDGTFAGLDGAGVVFRSYPVAPEGLPVVRSAELAPTVSDPGSDPGSDPSSDPSSDPGSDPSSDPSGDPDAERGDALREVALVVTALPASITARVGHVEVDSLDSIALVLRDGTLVRWGSAAESDLKAEVLQALMQVPAGTYDVSVPALPTTSGAARSS